jgi:predicted phosphodiesterase
MKILAVSDKDDSKLQACILQNMKFLQDIDVIVSCGDISSQYLEFLVDSLKKPLFFVRGNHQTFYPSDHKGYLEKIYFRYI